MSMHFNLSLFVVSSVLGLSKLDDKLSNVEFFVVVALADNFRLSQSKPPNFDYPQNA